MLPKRAVNAASQKDETVATTYQPETGLEIPPRIITEIDSLGTLEEVCSATRKPTNVVLSFDENKNVLDKNGEVIDSFITVYQKLAHTMVPIVRVESKEAANAFIRMMNNDLYILDIAVASTNPELISLIRKDGTGKRVLGVVIFEKVTNVKEVVRTATIHSAYAVILPWCGRTSPMTR